MVGKEEQPLQYRRAGPATWIGTGHGGTRRGDDTGIGRLLVRQGEGVMLAFDGKEELEDGQLSGLILPFPHEGRQRQSLAVRGLLIQLQEGPEMVRRADVEVLKVELLRDEAPVARAAVVVPEGLRDDTEVPPGGPSLAGLAAGPLGEEDEEAGQGGLLRSAGAANLPKGLAELGHIGRADRTEIVQNIGHPDAGVGVGRHEARCQCHIIPSMSGWACKGDVM